MNNKKNAAFIQRLCALFVDILLIGFVVSFFSSFLINNESYDKLSKEATSVMEDYVNKKIDAKTYVNREVDIKYDLSRKTALSSLVSLAIYILYFVIYQYKNNGQTIGKKFFKIRVVSNDDHKLNINSFVYRSLIVNSILIDLLVLSLVIIGTKNMYLVGSMILDSLRYIVIFTIVVMVLFRKDKRGLHDLIANTKVIKEV